MQLKILHLLLSDLPGDVAAEVGQILCSKKATGKLFYSGHEEQAVAVLYCSRRVLSRSLDAICFPLEIIKTAVACFVSAALLLNGRPAVLINESICSSAHVAVQHGVFLGHSYTRLAPPPACMTPDFRRLLKELDYPEQLLPSR